MIYRRHKKKKGYFCIISEDIKKKGTSFFHRDGRFRRKSTSPGSYLAMSKVKEGEVARDPASIEDVKTAGSFLSPI